MINEKLFLVGFVIGMIGLIGWIYLTMTDIPKENDAWWKENQKFIKNERIKRKTKR